MIGQVLRGRYRIIEELGQGSFGETYIAEDLDNRFKPRCVVKHLKPANRDPVFLESAKQLFDREAATLAGLGKQDQIPQLLASFEENQEFYLVQELIVGHPLSVELPANHRWQESKVIQLLTEVLSVLKIVHQQGVIHRDIKPDNLMRRQSDRKLVLIDFGVVKKGIVETGSQEPKNRTIVAGTYGYLSAEQERGDPKLNSDLYALGMIAIQALTGVHPKDLKTDSKTGEFAWQHLATVSPKLAKVLNKMVRVNYADRYQTATEASKAVQELQPKPLNWRLIKVAGGTVAASLLMVVLGNIISPPGVNPPPTASPSTSPGSSAPITPQPSGDPQRVKEGYINLEEALKKKDLKEADQITYELMLEIAGSQSKKQGRFEENEWNNFSCPDLGKIDQLWRDATQGTQGFSVQKKMLIEAKEVPLDYQVRVGWKDETEKWLVRPKYQPVEQTVVYEKEPDFQNPPPGHLPAKLAWWDTRDHRFERIYACKL
ncbi:protein kinase domain-containing protein [Phormidesmis sp. 146-35]